MRIISGKFKGRRLVSFNEDHIRPTTDRVKESLFNILGEKTDGARVLDLFAGTGNLGIEAISRGAASVDMVEVSLKSIQIIRKNLQALQITEGIQIHKSDVIKFIQNYEEASFDIILIDPPFPLKICLQTLTDIGICEIAHENTSIVVEHAKQELLPDQISTLRRVDSRDYGDKLLSFFIKESQAQ